MPYFLANLVDNPMLWKLQLPDKNALRHGIMPNLKVLEVGFGNGCYATTSLATGDNL